MSSSSRMTPRGWRVPAVMPEVPESSTNFFQRSKKAYYPSRVMSSFAVFISST